MNEPIIDPATLSEEQRDAIREIYENCINSNALIREHEKSNLNKNKVVAFRSTFACGMNEGAMAAMIKLFGSEFFTNQKG